VLPHVVDSCLLLSAIGLAWMAGQYPFVHGWLTAKIVGLLAYIGLGMLALKPGRPLALRGGALLPRWPPSRGSCRWRSARTPGLAGRAPGLRPRGG
jgi:hypothetical protein